MSAEAVLERAKAMVEPPLSLARFERRIAELKWEITKCDEQLAMAHKLELETEPRLTEKLFACERPIFEQWVKQRRQKAMDIRNIYRNRALGMERELNDILISGMYPRFSPEPLTWRDEQGWPLLALFNLDQSMFCISDTGVESPDYLSSRGLDQYYADVVARLKDQALKVSRQRHSEPSERVRAIIQARFEGIIPAPTRARILPLVEHYALYAGRIYLLAEVKEWTLEVGVLKTDPLVIGCLHNGSLVLIDAFDLTSLEEYIQTAMVGMRHR